MIDHLAIAWLVLAVVLGGAELAVPGVFLIFIAIAAALTGVASLALPDLPLTGQLLAFAVWSIVTILIGRRWYRDYPVAGSDDLLNDRGSRLIGAHATVVAAIAAGSGRVRVGDSEWLAEGPDCAAGTAVRIVGRRDTVLQVEPITANLLPIQSGDQE